jgi:diguanylate cyclase
MSAATGALSRMRANLPHGGGLPEREWRRRHRAMVVVLWGSAFALLPYGIAQGYSLGHMMLHLGPVVALALLAHAPTLGHRAQSSVVALGLMTVSAGLVHLSHGLIEAHFAFFVFIVALTMYEDWVPFLIAVSFVLLHHGIYGMLDPSGVYSEAGQADAPWKWAAIHAGFVAAAGFAGVVAWRFNEDVRHDMLDLAKEKVELVSQLEAMAHEDWLTGLPNRRAWDQRFAVDLDRADRGRIPITVALIDVDALKRVNDEGGHQAGDRLLKTLAAQWAEALRGSDFIARLGGDEFGVILYDCDADQAPELVQRLRAKAVDGPWSIGIATWDGSEAGTTLVTRADEALYGNKPARVAPLRPSLEVHAS